MPRKPPAKRAFSGMVGLPPEPEDLQKPAQAPITVLEPEPAPAVEVPKKRGRPRKHSSNAVKQDAYRKRKQEPERKALVAKILETLPRRHRDGAESEFAKMSIRKLKFWLKHTRFPRRFS